MFYVTDENGNDLAKKLSSIFAGRRFGIGCACSSSQFYLGREMINV